MKPLALIILDGFGIGEQKDNAIEAASTPFIYKLLDSCPNTQLGASGLDVGLPDGQMGNSEVGHTNIGAGRVVYQELTKISKAIDDGDFFENETLCSVMSTAKRVHIMGLLSDGGVHSHITHLFALMKLAKDKGVQQLFIHSFLDGRDTDPRSGIGYLKELEYEIEEAELGQISTVIGRYFAMDRDNRFDRVEIAYNAMATCAGEKTCDPIATLMESYANDVTDEFVAPIIHCDYDGIKDGDAVVFYNFRPDRAREITRAFLDKDFSGFDRNKVNIGQYVCMTQYDESIKNVSIAYPPDGLKNTLSDVLEQNGKSQLRIAETEKYAHVTFFFNGGRETPAVGEDRILIPSPRVATYDLLPQMSAVEVTNALLAAIEQKDYDLIVLNFANCDMVGHTGCFDAAVKAVETVDACLMRVVNAVCEKGGVVLLTADHGNADKMKNDEGAPMTAHTTNPVPFVVVGKDVVLREGGILADIAPTVLDLLMIEKPMEMTGTSLIK